VVVRAATLVFQSLLVGGIVFHRWIATDARAMREPGFRVRLLRYSAIALAVTQALRYIDSPAALYGTSYGVMVAVNC
jgi:hypothetical protein